MVSDYKKYNGARLNEGTDKISLSEVAKYMLVWHHGHGDTFKYS